MADNDDSGKRKQNHGKIFSMKRCWLVLLILFSRHKFSNMHWDHVCIKKYQKKIEWNWKNEKFLLKSQMAATHWYFQLLLKRKWIFASICARNDAFKQKWARFARRNKQ